MLDRLLHVKWFTEFDKESPMGFWSVVSDNRFLFWMLVTMAGLLICAVFNDRITKVGWIHRVHVWLDRAKPYLSHILRVGLAIGLIFQLMTGAYLAPELEVTQTWVTIVLVVALAGLLHRKVLWVSGIALLVLFATAIYHEGFFHGLDYVYYVGIAYYLIVQSSLRWKPTATPVLYALTGFSLAWVAFEKFTMPQLAYEIIEHHNIPTFGFSVEHFVLITAFIEIGLAWSFIVGILNRFVSALVTLVFITTTTVFGFTEVVGHTILHTLLIMFLIEGEGTFTTPFHFHHSKGLRYLFVLVNFCVLLFGFMGIYILIGS